ncbi:hypothetical protein HM1_2488 [Heliomicrobium modesticaldum Ice1]|uniref:Uncharacterized protein n=1 Tax=Heliobacterium modesticaldum (strain ATCC 51547 / Ice1) TaxID=498761 RepID=B0TAI7_HELMI|nr:hypothetical protein [Heliomicrobium modesticaldum]ABZ85037.1 hypothetical protein HM1_2488 [Heliomicrobium modesticaldum Ice1]
MAKNADKTKTNLGTTAPQTTASTAGGMNPAGTTATGTTAMPKTNK